MAPKASRSILFKIVVLFVISVVMCTIYEISRTMLIHGGPSFLMPQAQDTEKRPTTVLVLSYQRSGSSFTGRLFGHNPSAFYLFEPIDAVYSHMYGSDIGWNVPSDIFTYSNGTLRELPDAEIEAVTNTLVNVLKCDHAKLPLELFTHRFLFFFANDQPNLEVYRKCVDRVQKKFGNVGACYRMIDRNVCPGRFDSTLKETKLCKDIMSQMYEHKGEQKQIQEVIDQWKTSHISMRKLLDKPGLAGNFTAYHDCMSKLNHHMQQCALNLSNLCETSTIRSTKTVRVSMETVSHLLPRIPHLKVIHLLRDPRPVVLSRSKNLSFKGKHSGDNLTAEAELYCKRAYQDIKMREELERSHPQTFLQLVYDEFVRHPMEEGGRVYDFLGEAMEDGLRRWLRQESNSSARIADAWKDRLVAAQYESISHVCKDLLRKMNLPYIVS